MRLSQLRLDICRCRTNHGDALGFSILSSNKSKSSGYCVNENCVALLDFVRLVHERENGRGLIETSSSGSGVDTGFGRDGEDLVPGGSDVFRVGA